MGNQVEKIKPTKRQELIYREPVTTFHRQARASIYGRYNCKSCWYADKNLIECGDHFMCINCLSSMLSRTKYCELCSAELPRRITVPTEPSAPPTLD
ncbi:zinc finger protein [Xapuri virus]|uniref:RING finger protein Z n=1 Tax=Xapuri virus TaxID=2267561 RepID=A0A2Z5DEN9_9VIRU|nr:zinc finger protein [Xapuri virus]AXB49213.1 zinc finger protein [Xapuri virus]